MINKTRFDMVKKRHESRFTKAVESSEADRKIMPLCKYINKTKDFFTTSSCSGRILLLGLKGMGKGDAYFHRKWHRTVSFDEVWEALQEQTFGDVWFKMEPFIIHIGTKNIESAEKILELKNKAGVKRGGIISLKPGKCIVELIGTETIAMPVKTENSIIAEKKYLEKVIEKANQRMDSNAKRLEELEKAAKAGIK